MISSKTSTWINERTKRKKFASLGGSPGAKTPFGTPFRICLPVRGRKRVALGQRRREQGAKKVGKATFTGCFRRQSGMEREGRRKKGEKEKAWWRETGWLLDDERTARQDCIGSWGTDREGVGVERNTRGWGRRTISILIPPWGVDVARTNRREDANTDGTPLAMLWKRRERVRLQLVHTAYVRACVRLFRARCYQRGRVDLYPFYCRGILAFANTAGHAAPGFSPHDGISLFPSQGILNGFPFPRNLRHRHWEKKQRHACLHAFFPALRALHSWHRSIDRADGNALRTRIRWCKTRELFSRAVLKRRRFVEFVVLESIKLSRSADEQLVGNSGKWNSFKIHILGIVFQSIAVMFYFKH